MRLGTINFGVSLKNQIFSRLSSFSKLYFDYCLEIFGCRFFCVKERQILSLYFDVKNLNFLYF